MSNTVISIDSWEHSKENILPVKSGRKPSSLARAFSGNSSTLENEREEFKERIKNTEEDNDPITVWIEYYEWAKENFPTSKKEQLNVIQSVTKLYRNSTLYQNDERYLRFWIIYADMLSNPIELFQYLFNKDIGTNWALFYEVRAHFQENMGKYTDADETYKLGINRKVEPIERIKRNYNLFTERMAERVKILQKKREERNELDQQRSHTSSRSHRSSRKALSTVNSSGSRTLSYSTMPKVPLQNTTNRKIVSILQDDPSTVKPPSTTLSDNFKVQWDEFATEKESTKENILKPSAWKGKTIPQKIRKRSKQCSFSIYIDPECEEQLTPTNENVNEYTPEKPEEEMDITQMIKTIKSRVS